jgi:hypothetical protein
LQQLTAFQVLVLPTRERTALSCSRSSSKHLRSTNNRVLQPCIPAALLQMHMCVAQVMPAAHVSASSSYAKKP